MIQVLEGLNTEIINLIRFTGRREREIESAKANNDDIWKNISNTVAEHHRLLAIGEKHTRQKAIQDPVHGAILLEPWELDLISGWEMLRLRFI